MVFAQTRLTLIAKKMKVILRNTANNLYVQDQNLWTNDPWKALDFERADRALEAARRSGLKELELMVSLNGVNFEVRKPVQY